MHIITGKMSQYPFNMIYKLLKQFYSIFDAYKIKYKQSVMKLEVKRFGDNGETTLGALYIDGILECFTVEDQQQATGTKIMGETRVPEGTYEVSLRREGGFHAKYTKRYGSMHKGMLCIHNAPNWKLKNNGIEFQYILIHTGNTDDHTMGCLLVNDAVSAATYTGSSSVNAYKDFYPKVAKILDAGGKVSITYTDVETGQ